VPDCIQGAKVLTRNDFWVHRNDAAGAGSSKNVNGDHCRFRSAWDCRLLPNFG
jgi:hypothetical protein